MAQHRTKQEKVTAQIRREQQYSLQDLKLDSPPVHLQSTTKTAPIENISGLSPKFIWADLLRTFISSAFVFGILIGIWWYNSLR